MPTSMRRRKDANFAGKDFVIIGLAVALTVVIIIGVMVQGGSLFGFGGQNTTVNVKISENFSAEIWDGDTAQYVEDPAYFVNAMEMIVLYMDIEIIDMLKGVFEENASAVITGDILDNESIGFGFLIYTIPFGTPGNESIQGLIYSITLDAVIIPSIVLLVSNTTDDFSVEGGIENQSKFVDLLFSEDLNKTSFEELVGDLFYGGTFNIELTSCQYYDPSTSRIYANVNGEPVVFDEDFFVSP